MKFLIRSALFGTALILGGAAIAQTAPEGSASNPVPLCSKTVKDKCMNPSQAPQQMMHRVKHSKGHVARKHPVHHNPTSR